MKRTLEPELMTGEEQTRAYAMADFESSHGRTVELFEEAFPGSILRGPVLDLGCGPGDVTFRFARRFPETKIEAVDGSPSMVALAVRRQKKEGEAGTNISFRCGVIPEVTIPELNYGLVMSTSLLHHLPDPSVLWETLKRYSSRGTKVFVYDLLRPRSVEQARELVERYSGGEPAVLKQDFYQSLLAAFTPGEVTGQLRAASLQELSVRVVSDRHLLVTGVRQ